MTFSEYAARARTTAVYPGSGEFAGLAYVGLGLAAEAGECANHVKKVLRDDSTTRTAERKAKIAGELGDVLWYVAGVCRELGLDMEQVAQANLDKLADRFERKAIVGHGSER